MVDKRWKILVGLNLKSYYKPLLHYRSFRHTQPRPTVLPSAKRRDAGHFDFEEQMSPFLRHSKAPCSGEQKSRGTMQRIGWTGLTVI